MDKHPTASIRVSNQALASLQAMRHSTGASYRFLIDGLIEDRRLIVRVRAELDKMLPDLVKAGNPEAVKVIQRIAAMVKG